MLTHYKPQQKSTDRVRAHRARLREQGIPTRNIQKTFEQKEKRNNRARKQRLQKQLDKPFIGCDGEGCGVDELGRQNFMLFRIGEEELYTGKPLSTLECLEFICQAPDNAILVGFAFGYDTTMILKDLPGERRARLLRKRDVGIEGGFDNIRYTYYKDYGIEYLQRNYLKVCRLGPYIRREGQPDYRRPIEGSARIINDVFGFFQGSFLNSLKKFNIGVDYWDMIEEQKSSRADFLEMTDEVRYYNHIECTLLAELMEEFRRNCIAADIVPKNWRGAGNLATRMLKDHETVTKKIVDQRIPEQVRTLAEEAYYGGRFEITRTGKIPGPVYEYDINSAYPSAMLELPCLVHGTWEPVTTEFLKKQPEGSVYISNVKFVKPGYEREFGELGGLPIRHKDGYIQWTMEGNGVYWSYEIESAKRLGFKIHHRHGWLYNRECDCQPFSWVDDKYEYRKSLGKANKGYPIKLGLNSLYGKQAQRVGTPEFGNFIWAGLITAITRARLNDAIALNPRGIIMLATDGVYSNAPLELPIGDTLGTWEENILEDGIFIVQPGFYWSGEKLKARGASKKKVDENRENFETVFAEWREQDNAALKNPFLRRPHVNMTVHGFIGMKLAQARGKPETAGCWTDVSRTIKFDWSNKRAEYMWQGEHIITKPYWGGPNLISIPHRDFILSGKPSEFDAIKLELEDQPDYTVFEI
jgi:hypothetical protein